MKLHIALLLSGVFFLCFFTANNVAISAPRAIRIAFSESPPAKMFDKNGQPSGIDTEFIEELAHRLGLQVQYDIVPFKRGLLMLKQGSSDLMTGVLMREDRKKYLHFLQPAYRHNSDKAFYVRKGDEDTIRTHQDLHTVSIATVLGARYYPAFDSDSNINKIKVSDPDAVFTILAAKRVDAAISWELSGDYRIAKLGLSDRISKTRYAYREKQDVFVALSQNSPFAAMLPQIQQEMKTMIDEGVYEQIKQKYLQPQSLKE